MRLVGRIVVVCAGATLPAVVAVIGCAVDSDRYPGIKNSIPNGPKVSGATSSSTSSTSTSASSSTSSGALPTLCDCAAAFVSADGGACLQCATESIKEDAGCGKEQTACTNSNCTDALSCVANCAGDPACIAACIVASPVYRDLLNCECSTCLSACSVPAQVTCNLDGTGGGGTGGAGTGGGPADAGGGG